MKWKSFKHNGIAFPPRYEARQLSVRVKGGKVELSPEAEELAYAWGKKRLTPYVQDPVFQSNFLGDFAKLLPREFQGTKYTEIDWTPVHEYLNREEQQRTDPAYKKSVAQQRKELRIKLKERFGYVEIDGVRTEIANWMAEPPSLFMGRGSHPLRGKWKPRVQSEDVVLNLSKDAPVPDGNWKEIVHYPDFMWIGYWVDKLSEVRKYVWPSDISNIRQERDRQKFELAKKLTRSLANVRKNIDKGLGSEDVRIRKLATVCYLIDNLAMRVGDEKDEDEADTVGASTLRVEHLKFHPSSVEFDFLGKDSVRWQKTMKLDGGLNNLVRRNLQEFSGKKKPGDPMFDGINSASVNKFLGSAMKGLTAKVFRTHHATETVQKYLDHYNGFGPDSPVFQKLYRARLANLEAAIRCNHKRTIPKTWESSLEKKQVRLNEMMTRE
ncbi:MAG TPA: hypothetical protein VE177_03355, partial [Candidatus Binatus sp.]|nr:hypothetical protein [Candidatus Binatus sp.]